MLCLNAVLSAVSSTAPLTPVNDTLPPEAASATLWSLPKVAIEPMPLRLTPPLVPPPVIVAGVAVVAALRVFSNEIPAGTEADAKPTYVLLAAAAVESVAVPLAMVYELLEPSNA